MNLPFQPLSEELVKAIQNSELSDEQLDLALDHYEALYCLLDEQKKVTGNLYDLVLRDVRDMYYRFRNFKETRQRNSITIK